MKMEAILRVVQEIKFICRVRSVQVSDTLCAFMARAVEADNSENAANAAQQICSASVKPSSFARFVCSIVGRCSPTKKIFRFFVGLLEIDVYKIDVGA